MNGRAGTDRTWEPPQRPWSVSMTWSHLAFLHWRIDEARLRPLIPPQLEIDTFDGTAWLGVVPFLMENVRHRPLPRLPGCSTFPELNVRTYVTVDGKPGVWFFSLDAMSRLAVWAARAWFGLPYYYADMQCHADQESITYRMVRRGSRSRSPSDAPVFSSSAHWWVHPRGEAKFRARYRPTGPVYVAHPGTLDYFLTARYCLYCCDGRGQLVRSEIDHVPWPLQPAEVELEDNTVADVLGLGPLVDVPRVHFVSSIDTVAWPTEAVAAEAPELAHLGGCTPAE